MEGAGEHTHRLGLFGSFSFLARFFFSGAAAFTFFSSLVETLGMVAAGVRGGRASRLAGNRDLGDCVVHQYRGERGESGEEDTRRWIV